MAEPTLTHYQGDALAGPGMFWVNSRLKPDPNAPSLTTDQFTQWYEAIHIPDIFAAKPGGITAAWRYQCLDPSRPSPFLAVYKVPDMGFLQTPEFESIPVAHGTLPGGGPIYALADFDARFLSHVETWKSSKHGTDRGRFLISEAIEPVADTTDAFHHWYCTTYINEVSSILGWQRTSRFELVFKKENPDDPNLGKVVIPRWLTLHEFTNLPELAGGGSTLLGSSDETRDMEKSARKIDVAPFRILSEFGDHKSPWVDAKERLV